MAWNHVWSQCQAGITQAATWVMKNSADSSALLFDEYGGALCPYVQELKQQQAGSWHFVGTLWNSTACNVLKFLNTHENNGWLCVMIKAVREADICLAGDAGYKCSSTCYCQIVGKRRCISSLQALRIKHFAWKAFLNFSVIPITLWVWYRSFISLLSVCRAVF